MTQAQPLEHFFRHQYGSLVARLSHIYGVQQIASIEDAVQSALLKALQSWSKDRQPDNPAAWLFRVAQNLLLDELKLGKNRARILEQKREETETLSADRLEHYLNQALPDDLLQMLFLCCEPKIAVESQLVLALKLICGFSVDEIALRLFTTQANIYKRFTRARNQLKQNSDNLQPLSSTEQARRLQAVQRVLYLLFTEGYLSVSEDRIIRVELCDEAVRLTRLVSEHAAIATTETYALLALMCLQRARITARTDPSGGLLLLEEQDRSRWEWSWIEIGMKWLAKSSKGENFSRYHGEAGVAAEHCMAASFSETRWDRIAECYELLETISPSAIHRLNRAIAVAEFQGPAEALKILEADKPPSWLEGSYQWAAVMADLYRREKDYNTAQTYALDAIHSAPTQAIKDLLTRRLAECLNRIDHN